MATTLAQFDHQAWYTMVGMLVSYGIILVGITVVLFILPYFVFMAL